MSRSRPMSPVLSGLLFGSLVWLLVIAFALLIGESLRLLPACEYEDSPNCYWDAAQRGNGEGVPFANVLIFTIPLP